MPELEAAGVLGVPAWLLHFLLFVARSKAKGV